MNLPRHQAAGNRRYLRHKLIEEHADADSGARRGPVRRQQLRRGERRRRVAIRVVHEGVEGLHVRQQGDTRR